ncbi:hypothetical protein CHARACLAT_031645 [Characodon lateralis]|uniref:Uncharacterized protein n=1 Tax=Characodon lateralis TaxID=208331 RepID=A0ABU7CWW3_9TELE|nr:hypothetical protein [Characodon lateralis]
MSAADTGIMKRNGRKRRPETSSTGPLISLKLEQTRKNAALCLHSKLAVVETENFVLSPLSHRSQGFSILWPSLSHACTLSIVVIISNKTRTNYPATPAICDFYRLYTNSM